ncbi:inositol-pentakisphosphate 2-kinase [Sitodiplosis mosellana]|uniref:inositol-pentakisphosphate 2-kinase n=1 Tax=Sitodiplosis mosellana TaxID=263140 RepID=UPI0024446392|nr:inositol-pentakisphosphate 2-kinase [Sitodiplosis mosellana]
MATDNSQLDFRLKIYVLELDTVPITMAPPLPSSTTTIQQSSSSTATTASTVNTAASVTDYVTRTIDTFDISRNSIDYRAEGNANIVLAIPHRCQVLRLPKKFKSKQNICRAETAKEYGWQNERIFYVYKYIDRVSTLFGPNISSRPILVRIEFCNVDSFDTWLHNHRPLHRIQSMMITMTPTKRDDFDFDYGLLYHDACSLNLNLESVAMPRNISSNSGINISSGDVLAVEIKPKQGWDICALPEWLLELFEIGHGVRNKCRFCAMQHLKVRGRQVHQLSKYCPLDLFSGDAVRMKKSIRNLITAPQNNFRIFRNGQLVFGDDDDDDYQEHALQSILSPYFGANSNNVNDFISLLVNMLQYDFVSGCDPRFAQVEANDIISESETAKNQLSACITSNSSHLPKQSVLKRVLDLQLLAKKTIPYVAQKYTENSNGWENLIRSKQWPHLHVIALHEKLGRHTTHQNPVDVIDYEYLKSTCNLSDEEIYEIGATALDSSIMLTFQSCGQQTNHNLGYPLVKLNDQQFIVNATVFDLDPKLYPRHFMKYVQKTRESFNAYKLFLGAKHL